MSLSLASLCLASRVFNRSGSKSDHRTNRAARFEEVFFLKVDGLDSAFYDARSVQNVNRIVDSSLEIGPSNCVGISELFCVFVKMVNLTQNV